MTIYPTREAAELGRGADVYPGVVHLGSTGVECKRGPHRQVISRSPKERLYSGSLRGSGEAAKGSETPSAPLAVESGMLT